MHSSPSPGPYRCLQCTGTFSTGEELQVSYAFLFIIKPVRLVPGHRIDAGSIFENYLMALYSHLRVEVIVGSIFLTSHNALREPKAQKPSVIL